MSMEDDMIVWNVEVDETTCYQAAGIAPITCKIVNSTSAYLLAA